MALLVGVTLGLALLAAYVAFGVWAIRATWAWSVVIGSRPLRALLVSFVAAVLFMPGVVGAGHGVGIGPAWLMFATGTFSALTSTSKLTVALSSLVGWAIAFLITIVVTRARDAK